MYFFDALGAGRPVVNYLKSNVAKPVSKSGVVDRLGRAHFAKPNISPLSMKTLSHPHVLH